MKVLLVEDHPAVARITCDLLHDLYAHDVVHASTGESALAAVARSTPDLVLIDINLPDTNGYALAARLRANPALAATRLVALTGYGNQIDPERASSAGLDACFRKPMDFELLPTIARRTG